MAVASSDATDRWNTYTALGDTGVRRWDALGESCDRRGHGVGHVVVHERVYRCEHGTLGGTGRAAAILPPRAQVVRHGACRPRGRGADLVVEDLARRPEHGEDRIAGGIARTDAEGADDARAVGNGAVHEQLAVRHALGDAVCQPLRNPFCTHQPTPPHTHNTHTYTHAHTYTIIASIPHYALVHCSQCCDGASRRTEYASTVSCSLYMPRPLGILHGVVHSRSSSWGLVMFT